MCALLLAVLIALPMDAQVLSDAQRQAVAGWLERPADDRPGVDTLDLPTGLTAQQAAESLGAIWAVYKEQRFDAEVGDLPLTVGELEPDAAVGAIGMRAGNLTLSADMEMRYLVLRKERALTRAGERPLFICTHGSGPTPQEWNAQIRLAAQLYEPEGVYFVPRMPEGSGKRWIRGHNQDTYERVIEQAIAHWGVDPNRVYFLGISQGGFATDKLLPFMPDRFAAGNAMASGVNPNNFTPENLRNTVYRTDVGENDTTFNRVGNAIRFHKRLDELHAADPDGYVHSINVQKGRGHGINYKPGVSYIAKHTRNPWPTKLVWHNKAFQDRRRTRHYWIQIEGDVAPYMTRITAEADREQNTITITADQIQDKPDNNAAEPAQPAPLAGVTLHVLLHDELLDLDKPVQVIVNGEQLFNAKVHRSAQVQLRTLAGYGDPSMSASGEVAVKLK